MVKKHYTCVKTLLRLAAAKADYAFVTSVDAPHLSANFVEEMFAFGIAAAPVAEDRVQVLSAIYPGDAGRRLGVWSELMMICFTTSSG